MKNLYKALTAAALSAALVGASLLAAAPASAAKPVKSVCYEYTWNVLEPQIIVPGTPGDYEPPRYETVGEFSSTGDGFYDAEQGGVRVESGTGSVEGVVGANMPVSVAQSGDSYIYYQNDDYGLGWAEPSGFVVVDLDADGSGDVSVGFEDISTLDPTDTLVGVGFRIEGTAQGWVAGAYLSGYSYGFYRYVEASGTPGTPDTWGWVVTGNGQGKVVPTNTYNKRYEQTGQVVVPCAPDKPGKGR